MTIKAIAEQALARLAREPHESLHERNTPLARLHDCLGVVQSCKGQNSADKNIENNILSLHESARKAARNSDSFVQDLHESRTRVCTRQNIEQLYPQILTLPDGRMVALRDALNRAGPDDWPNLMNPETMAAFASALLMTDPQIWEFLP